MTWKTLFLALVLMLAMTPVAYAEPAAPSNLQASIVDLKVDLSWRDNASNEDIYYIERRNSSAGAYSLLATLSRNLVLFRDSNPPKTGPVWYRVKARNGAGFSAYSNEVLAGTDLGLPLVVRQARLGWDFIDSRVAVSIASAAQILGAYDRKGYSSSLQLGTSYQSTLVGTLNVASFSRYTGHTYYFLVSDAQAATLWAAYPTGLVPYGLKLEVNVDGVKTLLLNETGSLQLRKKQDDYEYKVALFQVAPPGSNLSTKNVCLRHDASQGGRGFAPVGNAVADCVAAWDWGTNARYITVRSVGAMSLLFSAAKSTVVSDVTSLGNQREDRSGEISVFSLNHLGKYWEGMLAKHGITSTARLGRNPRFRLVVLPLIEVENTLTSDDHGAVKDFFEGIAVSRGIDLTGYDFVAHVQFHPGNYTGKEFNRSFAAGRRSYSSLQLSSDNIVFNKLFLTVAHEMGHQMFSLPDRYDGFGVRLPTGVPDPARFPQKNACLMAKLFAWAPVSATLANAYSTMSYKPEYEALGLDRFHTEDPDNQVLCPDDILKIRGP